MKKIILTFVGLLAGQLVIAQSQPAIYQEENPSFFSDVKFGGGFSLGFSNYYTTIGIAPMMYKPVNKYLMAGVGVQYSYMHSKNSYVANSYGYNLVGIVRPINELELSLEWEQLHTSVDYKDYLGGSDSFWNHSLFVGGGYVTQNIAVGLKYNLLHNQNRLYTTAYMPYVRVMF